VTRWGRFWCWLDSHKVKRAESYDGCSFVSHCCRCSVRVLQDSQGNWFAAPKLKKAGEKS